MTGNLFDGARFGDRFLTKKREGCYISEQNGMWTQLWNFMEWAYITYNLMTDDRFYSVYDDGKSVMDGKRPMLIQ